MSDNLITSRRASIASEYEHSRMRVKRSAVVMWHGLPRDLAVLGMETVWNAWLVDPARQTAKGLAKAARDAVALDLGRYFYLQWRHERAALFAQGGTDPVDGFEWIYTVVPTADHVIAAADLPDPAWKFDAIPAQGQVRGSQTYRDGKPATIPTGQWAAVFRRPYKVGTAPGASMGAVAWERRKSIQ